MPATETTLLTVSVPLLHPGPFFPASVLQLSADVCPSCPLSQFSDHGFYDNVPPRLLVGERGAECLPLAGVRTDGVGRGTEAAGRSRRGNAPW